MKLSVIIPVYQVEQTLNQCVTSVLNQNIHEMEVILVDDGSPDDCPQMCDMWAEKDHRICVIHQDNGGLSSARNAGICRATGTYITFVDSDDMVSPNTYNPLLNMIGDCDILEYSIANRLTLADCTYTNINEYWYMSKAYTHTYAWNKIYKRSLFKTIRFPEGKIFEDVYTFPLLLKETRKIITTSKGFYLYSRNPYGITANADGQGLAQLLDANLTNGMPMDDTYYMHLVNIQMDVWEKTGGPLKLLPRHLSIGNLTGRQRIKALVINIFGLKTLCRINKVIHHFKQPNRW